MQAPKSQTGSKASRSVLRPALCDQESLVNESLAQLIAEKLVSFRDNVTTLRAIYIADRYTMHALIVLPVGQFKIFLHFMIGQSKQ